MLGPLSATLEELYTQHYEEQHITFTINPQHHNYNILPIFVYELFYTLTLNKRQAKLILKTHLICKLGIEPTITLNLMSL